MIKVLIVFAAVLASGTAGAVDVTIVNGSSTSAPSPDMLRANPMPTPQPGHVEIGTDGRPFYACPDDPTHTVEDCYAVMSWTLYTQTYGGRIGVVHGLTKDLCEIRRKQALGEPATAEEKAAAKMFAVQDGLCALVGSCVPPYPKVSLPFSRHPFVVTVDAILHAECRDKPLP